MPGETIKDGEASGLDTWPDEQPFPLTDAECAALARGHLVKWPGTIDDLMRLPGRYELIEGWLLLRR